MSRKKGECKKLLFALIAIAFIFAAQNALAQAPTPAPSPAAAPAPTASAAPAPGASPVAGSGAPSSPEALDPNLGIRPPPPVFAGILDPFDYDPKGRRDPFGQAVAEKPLDVGPVHGPLLPLQRFELNQLRLTGILWDVRAPKALIRDPDGKTHIIGPNAKIGPRNGYVASIREGEIVVVETIEQGGRLVSTAQVVKIGK